MTGVGDTHGGLSGECEDQEEDMEAAVCEDGQGEDPEGCLDDKWELARPSIPGRGPTEQKDSRAFMNVLGIFCLTDGMIGDNQLFNEAMIP